MAPSLIAKSSTSRLSFAQGRIISVSLYFFVKTALFIRESPSLKLDRDRVPFTIQATTRSSLIA
ncbi:MAG: hypothetical protein KBE15_07955 [Budvicia sp.]|nr:hypothetical protein [Budvicia sp.]GKX49744.1 hypothetical protein SOASR029_00530 [Budvicia aquatica]